MHILALMMIPLLLVAKSAEDGSFRCLFLGFHIFSPKNNSELLTLLKESNPPSERNMIKLITCFHILPKTRTRMTVSCRVLCNIEKLSLSNKRLQIHN